MNKTFLIQQLNAIENARRVNRLRVANLVLGNPILFEYLLQIVFEFDNKVSVKAAWVLEFVCVEKLNWLAPHLTYFTKNIANVKFDSAIRPVSKICELFVSSDVILIVTLHSIWDIISTSLRIKLDFFVN